VSKNDKRQDENSALQNSRLNEEGPSGVASRDQLDLVSLFVVLWAGKWLVLASALLITCGAIAYALAATEWYRSEVLMMPAEKKSLGLAGQLGGLGGLASLAGITVGDGGTAEPLAVLTSRDFTRSFIEDENLMPILFEEKWDKSAKQWSSPNKDEWPDIRDAIKFFGEKIRGVREDRKTGLITVSIRWTDPEIAANWANLLVNRVNSHMRQRALTAGQANVAYLQRELATATLLPLQESVGRLLETELQKVMMAKGNEEFAFRVIDRADKPKFRESPKRSQIVVVGFLAGGFLGVFIVFGKRIYHRARVQ
jgi:uncharacterized protein involved in exopolysaccharide biosynthesis